jgi:two-component system catabolic regulation response regulator CreB
LNAENADRLQENAHARDDGTGTLRASADDPRLIPPGACCVKTPDAAPSRRRILIVEDEPGIADTILYALGTDGFEPHVCALGGEALRALEAGEFALAILDVGLPDMNGFDLFRQIRTRGALPVIFVTARAEEVDRIVGLELGADDYVAKPFSPRELVARVRTVLRRTNASSAGGAAVAAASGGVFRVDEERQRITFCGHALDLTRYEYGVLKTLVARPGRVFTRDELLDRVWGDATESIDRTVDAHIKTLRAKLKAIAPGLDPIRTHRGSGYALADDLRLP